jgi:hypothetical protein
LIHKVQSCLHKLLRKCNACAPARLNSVHVRQGNLYAADLISVRMLSSPI